MRTVLLGLLACGVILWMTGNTFAAHSIRNGVAKCHDCHVPHKAATEADPGGGYGVPLWSTAQTADGLPTFTLYSSQKFNALGTDISQPDGAAKLCLGCHDGSYSRFLTNPARAFGAGKGMGDMNRQHPMSFSYTAALAAKVANGGLRNPDVAMSGLGGTITQDLLDGRGKMQCTSCHDVHAQGVGENMLRVDWDPATGTDNVLCRICHNK